MKLYSFIAFLFLSGWLCILSADETVSFRYGVIAKSINSKDSVYSVLSESGLKAGDSLRINLEFQYGCFFYMIALKASGDYRLAYFSNSADQENGTRQIFASLPWMPRSNDMQIRSFFLISANRRLDDLETLFNQYSNAKKRTRTKFRDAITKKLESLSHELHPAAASITRRLEQPVIGGVIFRGLQPEMLTEQSLTHQCQGIGVAIAEITIDVKN